MSKQIKFWIVLAIGVFSAAYIAGRQSQNSQDAAYVEDLEASKDQSLKEAQTSTLPNGAPSASPAVRELTHEDAIQIFKTPIQSPDLAAIREEVKKDPHATPMGLTRFGAELGARISIARESEDNARIFLSQMKDCVSSESHYPAAEAMCLLHTQWIIQTYPQLKDLQGDIQSSASSEARRIFDRMNRKTTASN
jgi:pyruvate/2-oxoglutarate dehydrogenase complex dihydrolipoamide acyltransferase (E2) component